MKVAIIGSRNLFVDNLQNYIPSDCSEIVSGGARGIDTCTRNFAMANGLILREFLPEYNRYGRRATILRNKEIAEYADLVIAFWDGCSRGTKFVIDYCKKLNKECRVILNEGK